MKKDTNKIQKIISESFKNLYSNKLENQEETDKSVDTYALPKLNQEDTNRSIMSNETEA
jgi:hypothetical protein